MANPKIVLPAGNVVPWCQGCESNASVVVQVGDDPQWDSSTTWLCYRCLQKAVDVLTCPGCNDGKCVDHVVR